MDNTMNEIHNGLLRKFHTLCGRLGLTDAEKRVIVESFGVDSSKDIDTHDLINICASLSARLAGGKIEKMDKLRKRVIAAIGGYLRATRHESSIETIKSIACRATGYADFNKIPAERLQNVYNTFRNKQKDIDAVERLTIELLIQGMETGRVSPPVLN